MNPYHGATFFDFFLLFLRRLPHLWKEPLAIDEIQCLVMMMVACASSIVGALLMVKKMTMFVNALSHTILIGIVVAYLCSFGKAAHMTTLSLPAFIIASLVTALITAWLITLLHERVRLQEDASIALVFTSLFALGVVAVSLYTKDAHVGVEVLMGNIDAVHVDDLKTISAVCLINLLSILVFYKEWVLICFDSVLAANLGRNPNLFHLLLISMASMTAVASFRVVGVFLLLSFLIIPVATVRVFGASLKQIIWISSGLGLITPLFSVALSRHCLSVYQLPISTSAVCAVLLSIGFFLALLVRMYNQFREKKQIKAC